jgi:hypothetical protein
MILEKLYIINITIIPYIDDDSRNPTCALDKISTFLFILRYR